MRGYRKHYQPLLELGRGGLSRVFLCMANEQLGARKLLVVKTLLPELKADPEFLEMFLEEARLSARLNHPNVVQVYEVGIEDDEHFMTMEFLDGQSLEAIVRRASRSGPLPLPLHLHVLARAAAGLHYSHELADVDGTPLKLVHRDISPHNLFVTYQGEVKVLDFGIAKAVDSSPQTRAGVIKGKAAYMAPEQLLGWAHCDRRVDVFALGVLLWQAVTGKRFWAGQTDLEVLKRLTTGDIPSVTAAAPDLDPELAAIVQRAVAPARDDRYPTAGALGDALEAYLRGIKQRPNARALGAFVADQFADRRAKVQSIIQQTLGAPPTSSSDVLALADALPSASHHGGTPTGRTPHGAAPPPSGGGAAAEAREPAPLSASPQHTPPPITPPRPSGRTLSSSSTTSDVFRGAPARRTPPTAVLVAALALCLSVLAAVFLVTRGEELPPPAPAASAPPPKVTRPAGDIVLRLSAAPADARLFLDGALLAKNPAEARFPKDYRRHELRVEAPGHLPVSQVVEYDENLRTIHVELTPDEASPAVRPAPSASAVRPAPRR